MLNLKQCQQCNELFTPRNDSPGIFCSKSCNATYHNKRRPKKERLKNNCQNCNNEIFRPKVFCNHSCSAIFNNKLRCDPIAAKKCPQCNKEFIKNTKFCSKQCGWDNKKKNYSLEYKRAMIRETYKRYIARKKYQTPVGEDLHAIKQFYLNCPKGYEVDHIIPLSKGGTHSLENLQYLTREENRKKSNKIL